MKNLNYDKVSNENKPVLNERMDSIIEFVNVVLPKVDHRNISDLKYLFLRLERPNLSHFTDSEKTSVFCKPCTQLLDEIDLMKKYL